jgi:hypothetical protein
MGRNTGRLSYSTSVLIKERGSCPFCSLPKQQGERSRFRVRFAPQTRLVRISGVGEPQFRESVSNRLPELVGSRRFSSLPFTSPANPSSTSTLVAIIPRSDQSLAPAFIPSFQSAVNQFIRLHISRCKIGWAICESNWAHFPHQFEKSRLITVVFAIRFRKIRNQNGAFQRVFPISCANEKIIQPLLALLDLLSTANPVFGSGDQIPLYIGQTSNFRISVVYAREWEYARVPETMARCWS